LKVNAARSGTHLHWFKSSYSSDTANCVEISFLSTAQVGVRDSKYPGPVVSYTADTWRGFVAALQAGEFNWRNRRQ
jgi:hypothetical protein